MADMRQIFTYPNNLATDYIDPNYVGDAFGGMTRRINHLLDGSYKTWLNPLVLTATTSEVMQNISKFGNFYENVSYAGHLSRYDFWNQPMVIATKKLIDSVPMTADVFAQPMSISLTTTNDFNDGMRVSTSGVDGTFGFDIANGVFPELYCKIISPTEIQVATDESLVNLVTYPGGNYNFTLTSDKFNVNSTRYIYEDANHNIIVGNGFNNVHPSSANFELDLTTIFGSLNIILPNGTPITLSASSGNSWSNDNRLYNTYYLYNIPTGQPFSPTSDHIYTLYRNTAILPNVLPTDRATMYSSLEFPLNGDIVPATILETNPAKIKFASALPLGSAWNIWIRDDIRWNSGRYFGKNGTLEQWAGSSPQSYAALFNLANQVIDPVDGSYTYEIYRDNHSGPALDFSPVEVPIAINISFMNKPHLTANSPMPPQGTPDNGFGWATVNHVRIKITKPWATDIIDGEKFYIYQDYQLTQSPYFLKSVPSLETSTYKIFDVYRNSGLTNILDISYLSNFQNSLTVPTSLNTDGSISLPVTTANSPLLGTYIQAGADYPQYGIENNELLTLNYASGLYEIVGKTQQSTRMNTWMIGFSDTERMMSPYSTNLAYDYSGGDYDGQPRFWMLKDVADIVFNSSGQATFTPTSTIQEGQNTWFNSYFKFNSTNPADNLWTKSTQYTTSYWNGKEYTLIYGGAYDNTSTPPSALHRDGWKYCPIPSNGPVYAPHNVGLKIGKISIYEDPANTGSPGRYENGTEVTDFPSSFPSRNSGGYPTFAYQTATAAPADYTGVTGTNGYCRFDNFVSDGQNVKNLGVYSNYDKTVANVNFDWTTRPYTGVTNSVDPAGDNYPVGIDVSNTNVRWYLGTIDWVIGQALQLTMNNSGGTAFVKTVYVNPIPASPYIEFYNDDALTNPYTSTDFISDWTPYIDASDTGYLQVFTQEPVHAVMGPNGFKYGSVDVAPVNSFSLRLRSTVMPPFIIEYPQTTSMNIKGLYVQTGRTNLIDKPVTTSTTITPVNPNPQGVINQPLVNSTTGNIGPYSAAGSNPYEIDTVSLLLPGNQTYHYRDANNQVVPGAQANTSKYWKAGSSTPSYYTNGAASATFSTTVDTDGYLQNVTLVEDPGSEGRYPTGEDIMVVIENKTDEHTPAPLPLALQADVFDTHDEWADNAPSNEKVWPDHVTPASASIVYNQPTIANMSQNGVKYTRSSGFTKWVLEVEYPPMKAEDFQKFHAVAQAMAGQSKSIYFKLRNKDNVSILWADMMKPGSSESALSIPTAPLFDYTPQGSLTLHLEGLTASDPEAFREGEVFIAGANENGSLHTAIGAAASNVFGETKVRMPYGIRSNMANSHKIFKNPFWAIVTLNSDAFEYSVDVNNYYTVSVAFDLDQWGS